MIDQLEDARVERVGDPADRVVATFSGQRVLGEVFSADAEEVDVFRRAKPRTPSPHLVAYIL